MEALYFSIDVWAPCVTAIMAAIITSGVSFIVLRQQIRNSNEIAKKDRDANMSYTRYQCEWQHINNIKNKVEVILNTFDTNRFLDIAQNLKIGINEGQMALNKFIKETTFSMNSFELCLDLTNNDNLVIWNSCVTFVRPFQILIGDAQFCISLTMTEGADLLNSIEKNCPKAMFEAMKSYGVDSPEKLRYALINYLVGTVRSFSTINQCELNRRNFIQSIAVLENNNKMYLNSSK